MRTSRTLNQVLLAGCACVALFAAAPVAWSQTLTTTPNPIAIQLPDTGFGFPPAGPVVSDTATLSGVPNFPSGSNIFFTLTNRDVRGSILFITSVSVTGNGSFTTPPFFLPTNGTPVCCNLVWKAIRLTLGSAEVDTRADGAIQVVGEPSDTAPDGTIEIHLVHPIERCVRKMSKVPPQESSAEKAVGAQCAVGSVVG